MPAISYTRPGWLMPYQVEIIEQPERYGVVEASTKIGKTTVMLAWLIEETLPLKPNQSTVWVAPIFSQSLIAFNRLREMFRDAPGFIKLNEGRMTATFVNGTMISFKSGDNPDSLYGDDYYAAVIDEASRIKEQSWIAIRTTLTKTNGRCRLIGNVKGRDNFFYKLAQKAKMGEADHFYRKVDAYEAARCGLLKLEEIEDAKANLPEVAFKELYLAEAQDGSNPFGYNFIKQCTFQMSNAKPVCFGIDLAKSRDWTVIIGLDANGCVCYFDRFQRDWKQTVDAIKLLPKAPTKIDSTGVGDPIAEEVQRDRPEVYSFKFTQYSKQQIMEGLAFGIQQRKITFPQGPIPEELENFEFEYTRTGVKYSAPEGLNDDCVCALALAWSFFPDISTGGSISLSFI